MAKLTNEQRQALMALDRSPVRLSRQQYRAIRGQILAGHPDAAMRGLQKLTERRGQQWPKSDTR